jgi:hypothetical protein
LHLAQLHGTAYVGETARLVGADGLGQERRLVGQRHIRRCDAISEAGQGDLVGAQVKIVIGVDRIDEADRCRFRIRQLVVLQHAARTVEYQRNVNGGLAIGGRLGCGAGFLS